MKRRLQSSHEPHACVVLGVDTAQVSGWCQLANGLFVASGEFDVLKYPALLAVMCESALAVGRCNSLPAVLVYERPFMGTAQGQYIGAWKAAWAAAGGVRTRTLGVYPSQWRARVLGGGWARAGREQVREMEAHAAQLTAGRVCQPDEAAAVLIAKWGSHAGEVLAKLPKSMRGAA